MATLAIILIIAAVAAAIALTVAAAWTRKEEGRGPPTFVIPDGTTNCLRVWVASECPAWVHAKDLPARLTLMMSVIACLLDKPIPGPLDVIFTPGRLRCGRKWANGCYSPANGPDRPAAIAVSTGHETLKTDCLEDSAFCHEVLHHAGGLTDKRDALRLAELEREVRRRLKGGDSA